MAAHRPRPRPARRRRPVRSTSPSTTSDPHRRPDGHLQHRRRDNTDDVRGVSVPEGPHRDGHQFGMLAVFARDNISGGTNQLFPTGGGEPFFEVTLQPSQALVYDDNAMWHTATDIVALDNRGGHRD